ncbi:hypothetical protein [Gandjariella thermophila]|uniref:GH18 domain-containing protein n=1 Tax=Gandjariella thermophila TaxID=1931992 RepID=A0A4D4J491_9PSEU|nr:hypothetical protein [Gandjariella thermophila]GDY31341.1 hypothetical protein GTS_29740 [Gandjariella thermophila]
MATALVAVVEHEGARNPSAPNVTLGNRSDIGARLPDSWYGAAPYAMPLRSDPPDLPRLMAATGQQSFTLAVVRAPDDGGCRPAWDGDKPVAADTTVGKVITAVRAAGGDVSVSFGGYGGTKLGQVCGSAQATADAYQQVIDRYRLKAVDFDLEPPGYGSPDAVANELAAARILQEHNPGLYVSVTTAGSAAGTGPFGQQMLNQAKRVGFAPNNYAITPFGGGFVGSGSQISALEAFHGILMNTFGWDSATAYAREGFAGINGTSDAGEVFTQADFQAVLDYAIGHKLSRYTFFTVNRDRPCASPTDNGVCSNIPQRPGDFTTLTTRFGNATAPTASVTSAATAPPPPTAAMIPTTTTTTTRSTTTGVAVAPPVRYFAVAGPGCSNNSTGIRPVGYYTDRNTGWVTNTGGFVGSGCDGHYLSVPMSGDRYRDDENSMWWYFDTRPVLGGSCRVSVYVPDDGDIQNVGGHPTFYTVYSNDGSSGQTGQFTIDQVYNRGNWVDAGSFPVNGRGISIELHTRGQDWVGDQRTNAHHAAAQISATCT